MTTHGNPKPAYLTQAERIALRDQIAMLALPFCCVEANKGDGSLRDKPRQATEHAYIIADQMLASRGIKS